MHSFIETIFPYSKNVAAARTPAGSFNFPIPILGVLSTGQKKKDGHIRYMYIL